MALTMSRAEVILHAREEMRVFTASSEAAKAVQPSRVGGGQHSPSIARTHLLACTSCGRDCGSAQRIAQECCALVARRVQLELA